MCAFCLLHLVVLGFSLECGITIEKKQKVDYEKYLPCGIPLWSLKNVEFGQNIEIYHDQYSTSFDQNKSLIDICQKASIYGSNQLIYLNTIFPIILFISKRYLCHLVTNAK